MRRVRAGEIVCGAAGVALLAAMFLGWYSVSGRDDSLTAWAAFSVVDVLIAIVALLGIALALSEVVGRGPALPIALAVVTTTLSLAGTLLLAYRILNQPGPNDLISVQAGAYVGLLASIGVFLGAWLSLSDERPRPVDPAPPEPERRPTPARS
jgi:crotonobetainyl-CoA:carnitine CoA-transferase CaiB-like acyl-CoA transferase